MKDTKRINFDILEFETLREQIISSFSQKK